MKKNTNKSRWFCGIGMTLMVLAAVCFAWFALPLTLSVSLNIGNVTGLVVSVLLFLYGLWMPWVNKIFAKWRVHKVFKWLYRSILGVIAVIALLVVYCLRNIDLFSGTHGLPELLCVAVCALLHLWKRNDLLSIFGATVLYMVLVQVVFI